MNMVKKAGVAPSPAVLAKLIQTGKPLVARKLGLMKSADGLERATKPAKVLSNMSLLFPACMRVLFEGVTLLR